MPWSLQIELTDWFCMRRYCISWCHCMNEFSEDQVVLLNNGLAMVLGFGNLDMPKRPDPHVRDPTEGQSPIGCTSRSSIVHRESVNWSSTVQKLRLSIVLLPSKRNDEILSKYLRTGSKFQKWIDCGIQDPLVKTVRKPFGIGILNPVSEFKISF